MTMEEMWNMRASSTTSSAQPGFSATNQLNMDAQAFMAKEVCVIERTLRQEPMEGLHPDRLRSELLAMVSESQQHLARSSPYAASFCQARSPDYGGWPMQSPFIPPQANRSANGQGRSFRSHDSFPVKGSRAAQELGLEGSWHFPSSQWQREQKSTLNSEACKGASNMLNSGSGLMSQAQSGGFRVYCINYFGVPVVGQLGLSDAGRLGVACACHGQHMSVANFTQHSGLNAVNPGEVVYVEGGETLVQWRKSYFSQYGVKVPEDSAGWEWLDFSAAEAGKYVTQSLQKEENVCGPMSTGKVPKEAVLKRYRGANMTSELGSSMSAQLCTHKCLSRRTFQSMSYSSGHLSVHSGHHFLNDGGQRYSWAGGEQVSRVPRSGNHAASRLSELGQESHMRENDNASIFQPTQAACASMTTSSSVEHPKSFLFQQIMNKVWDGKLQHNVHQFNLPKVSGTTDQCGRTNRVDSCGLEDEQRSGFQSPSHSSQARHKPESGVSEFHGKVDSTLQSSRSPDRQLQREQMAAQLETETTLESLSAGALVHLSNKARQRLLETALQSAFSYRALGLQGPSSRVGAEGLSGNLDVYASFPEFLVRQQGRKQDPNQMRGLRTSFLQQQQQHPVEATSGREPQWQNSIIDRNGRDEQQEKVRGWSHRGFEADVMVKAGLELKVHDAVISRMQVLVDRESNEGRTVRGVDQEAITARVSVEVAPLTAGGDIMPCGCLKKCRKASPQAVPRLAVQACLNEKAGLSSSVEAAKNVEHATVESGAHIEQPDTVAAVEMEGVKLRRRNVETLACEGMEAAEECDQAIPKYDDESGATAVRGEAMIPEVDVCSNSSENVSSGLSDEGCAVSGDGGSGMVQGSGIIRDAGVVDEGSGIGKCWSSDDVDVGVGRNSNRLEDPSTVVGSPPSSSNMGKTRLVVKRRGKRASQSLKGEAEPVASTGKLERKQRRNMKWKWLGPGGEGGVAKEGSPASSFGHVAETQVTSEDARIRLKVQERSDALKRDFRVLSGEMVAPSKRRKLLIYQGVKATNVTEENLEAANLDLKRKAGTLVIRVPQGGNRQKAKKGIRTKLWRSSLEEDGGDGPAEAGKLMPPRPVGRPTKACSGLVRAVGSGPSSVTKNIRSPRTPLAGLSPRNGRMVSLSAILNQQGEARAVEGQQKLRDGVARLRTEGASVLEFTEDEDVAVSRPGKQATASAGVQTDRPKACPFPQGERSARPVKRSSAFGDAGKTPTGAGTYECQVSQVRSAAGSSISKEKLQQGFSFPMTKQVRSSKVKRSDGLQEKSVRELGAMKQVHVKAGVGLLKRKSDLCMAGVSAKRPRVVLALKKAKEVVVCEVGETSELFKSSNRESTLKTKKLVEDSFGSGTRIQKKENSQMLDVSGSRWRTKRVAEGIKKMGPADKCKCDVCGTFSSASYNKLLCCCRCPVKVHQACYGVPKVPKSPWMCRTCKFKVSNPICVLCGYGGGAMTRVQKARPFCLALLQIWRDLRNKSGRETYSDNDDNETLSSATNHIGMKSTGTHTMRMKEGESRDCEDHTRDDNKSVCKVCRKVSPEPGSTSGGNVIANHEDWRRHNTVGTIVKDGAKQWAHMVCTLWMPGTRCLNMGTMGMFDVSGVTASRRKALCSICQRKGGACIQCRVPKCSIPFHVWCAHEKGLLQSEIVQDGSNQVGFFGKCQSHGTMCSSSEAEEGMQEGGPCSSGGGVCARTEGYKGRLSLEERAMAQQQMTLEGGTAVTPEQVAAWLRISNRKMTALRRGVHKSANSGLKFDHREYLRFKQKKGWRKLAIYKSAIHALGLYTSDFIGEGEVVVEYVGEIVGLRVADKREAEYHSGKRLQHQGACYLFRIDADQIIDATRRGGIARFVNHSCSPNCVAKVICVDNLKKVIFFAKRHIHAGEEVTYDYKFNYDELDDKIPCFCGTPKCRGTLN